MIENEVPAVLCDILHPGAFFVAPGCNVRIEHRADLASWTVFLEQPNAIHDQPLISVELMRTQRLIRVSRNIRIRGWRGAASVNETMGSIDLSILNDTRTLRRLLLHCISVSLTGTSRLPITSLESPLPEFSLGRFGYFWSAASACPITDASDLVRRCISEGISLQEHARIVEVALRAATSAQIESVADALARRWAELALSAGEISSITRTLFNQLALSPYTSFVANLVAVLLRLGEGALQRDQIIDIIGYMLRHLVRHLTAFDLVKFHNRGANYPDALMLDTLLKAYLNLIDLQPESFEESEHDGHAQTRIKRLRRRALRQAGLMHKQCEGLAVPDAPTSPGENRRLLPQPFIVVPDEQLFDLSSRSTRLFVEEPIETVIGERAAGVLRQSMDDLDADEELQELGMAVFLDRPLGWFKRIDEPDRTPLLSYESFSRRIAADRVRALRQWGLINDDRTERLTHRVRNQLSIKAVPVAGFLGHSRGSVVALEDAKRAAMDFVFLRTTRSSLDSLLSRYDLRPMRDHAQEAWRWLTQARDVLLIRTPRLPSDARAFMIAYDQDMRPRVEFGLAQEPAQPVRYIEHACGEYLVGGLRVLRILDCTADSATSIAHDPHRQDIILAPELGVMPGDQNARGVVAVD
jgi:hypothetical protein